MTTRTHNNNGDAYLLQHKDLAEFIPDLLFSKTHNIFTIASKKNLQCNLFNSWDYKDCVLTQFCGVFRGGCVGPCYMEISLLCLIPGEINELD